MSEVIIDRFEGEFAIVEFEGTPKPMMRSELPDDAREGDILVLENNKWVVAHEKSDKLKKEIHELADKLWE